MFGEPTDGDPLGLMSDAGLLRKLVSRNGQLTQTELETVSHWVKQFAALMHGITCGTIPMVGLNALLSFSAVLMTSMWSVIRQQRLTAILLFSFQPVPKRRSQPNL